MEEESRFKRQYRRRFLHGCPAYGGTVEGQW